MASTSKITLGCLSLFFAGLAYGGAREQCYKMHNRLTGVFPSDAELQSCVTLVSQGAAEQAALEMTEHDLFYADTLKSLFSPWASKTNDVLTPFSDFSATAVGFVRDNIDFRTILSTDVLYTCEGAPGIPAFSLKDNKHYEACGKVATLKTALVQKKQVDLNPQLSNKSAVPAGIMTTRGFAAAFFKAGTNRAGTKGVLVDFLCENITNFHDTNVADFRVRQDVDRYPGAVPQTYLNECKGCHAGMDALTGAFAYADFVDESLVYDESAVRAKYFSNAAIFSDGFKTNDDQWKNLWNARQNARVGWGAPINKVIEGKGMKNFGIMMANTDQFARCMARQVKKKLCLVEVPLNDPQIISLGNSFKEDGYKMKPLFAKTAITCMGN